MAVLTVQFKVGVPRTEALVRLYDVLNANQDWLPRDLGPCRRSSSPRASTTCRCWRHAVEP
jgi:multidrug efflux pump subunit AcrB